MEEGRTLETWKEPLGSSRLSFELLGNSQNLETLRLWVTHPETGCSPGGDPNLSATLVEDEGILALAGTNGGCSKTLSASAATALTACCATADAARSPTQAGNAREHTALPPARP